MSWSCPVCSFAGIEDSSNVCTCGYVRSAQQSASSVTQTTSTQMPSCKKTMTKKEIKTEVQAMLKAGEAKSEVFSQLVGHGIKDAQLAYIIASYADPKRYQEHKTKANIIVIIMLIQTLFALLAGFGIGAQIGPNAKWIVALLTAAIPLIFAWFFYKNHVGAYKGYIALSIVQLPKSIISLAANPQTLLIIMLGINIAILAFVWYVRDKIFPGFTFIMPKKLNGKFVFPS